MRRAPAGGCARRWGAGVAGASALIVSSCCSGPPPAERCFDLLDGFNTLGAFSYAIDAHQWPYAYGALTPRSRELITYTKFRFAFQLNVGVAVDPEDPSLKVGVRDLVVGSERHRFLYSVEGSRERAYQVIYRVPAGPVIYQSIYVRKETDGEARAAGCTEGRWLIDLDRTLLRLQGARGVADGGTGPPREGGTGPAVSDDSDNPSVSPASA